MPDLKQFFETPQKARITIICLAVAAATLGAVAGYAGYALGTSGPGTDAPAVQSEAAPSAPAESGAPSPAPGPTQAAMGLVPTLTIEEARALALANAGVAEDQAEFTREALSEDNGIWVYEFRFHTRQTQYEYKLNANTGEVRALTKEALAYPSAGPTEPSMPSFPAETALPSAVPEPSGQPQPAQTDAPAPSQAAPSSAPAATPSPTPSQSVSIYIGMERAKAIALEHAGLSASQVSFTHARMGREDGRMVYKIEFRQGRVEYEYEIDASTGQILEHETDRD